MEPIEYPPLPQTPEHIPESEKWRYTDQQPLFKPTVSNFPNQPNSLCKLSQNWNLTNQTGC
jgi:hypothetical protein